MRVYSRRFQEGVVKQSLSVATLLADFATGAKRC